jgi:hypothetical protein
LFRSQRQAHRSPNFVPLTGSVPGDGGITQAAVTRAPTSQAATPFQGFEAQLEGARTKVRSLLRQQLKEEAAQVARAKTKQVKDELTQVQDVREGRSLASENSFQGDKMRLMEQVSTLEKESLAESDGLEKLKAYQSVMTADLERLKANQPVTTADNSALQAKQSAALLTAKKQVREVSKTCDELTFERDILRDEIDELAAEIEELKHELAKARERSLRFLGDRTKVNEALQVAKRTNKEQFTAAQSPTTALNQKARLLQASQEKSQIEDKKLNQQLQNRLENDQRKHDDLNRDFRRARTEHQTEMQRQSKELERLYRIKISKRDAIQQAERQQRDELQQQLTSLQTADNPPWHQQPVQVNGMARVDVPRLSMNNFSSVATRCVFVPTLKVRKGRARAIPRAKLL